MSTVARSMLPCSSWALALRFRFRPGCIGSRFRLRRRRLLSSSSAALRNDSNNATPQRSDFAHFEYIQTRWNDCDAFAHINNTCYYEFMDNGVNRHILSDASISPASKAHPRFVARTSCDYLRPFQFPSDAAVGLRVDSLGNSSVKYAVGIFCRGAEDADEFCAAIGEFIHVYVSPDGKPIGIPDDTRAALKGLVASP